MECLFCNIRDGEIPSKVVYEDPHVVAFLDIHPLALGHTVIIPKVHVENIIDMPDETVGPLFVAVKHVTALLERTLKPHGFTIGINHGKVSGQAVDHVHIHIIPRYESDGGTSLHAVVNNPPKESLDETLKKVKKYNSNGS